jgi:L-asparaginase / beta-aspartyl-peptidase
MAVGARWTLVIHGGAGAKPRRLPAEELEAVRETLRRALEAGAAILRGGGRGLDAVQSAVRVMEASGLLNAGRGAVLNRDGLAELDAAIMDGRGRRAGAVAAVRRVAHPIDLARAVMEDGRHVMLAGEGAQRFAAEQGITLERDEYFATPRRLEELEQARRAAARAGEAAEAPWQPRGTVGAVALDAHGDLAAATSTGGLTAKLPGRIGDSPIIGAGTYAENGVCAVSGTGAGEYFIRFTAAGTVASHVRFSGREIGAAAREVLASMQAAGGEGGLIAVDREGRIAMPFTSQTMLRGCADADGAMDVLL